MNITLTTRDEVADYLSYLEKEGRGDLVITGPHAEDYLHYLRSRKEAEPLKKTNWTKEEELKLQTGTERGLSITELASRLNRSIDSVQTRTRSSLGLYYSSTTRAWETTSVHSKGV